jgi:hypothetical protein
VDAKGAFVKGGNTNVFNVNRDGPGGPGLRYHGRFSARRWDGRFGRWVYYSPLQRRWFAWSAGPAEFIPALVNFGPPVPVIVGTDGTDLGAGDDLEGDDGDDDGDGE